MTRATAYGNLAPKERESGMTKLTGFSGIAKDTVVAFDYETYYHSKEGYSLRNMTPYDYVRDPRFDAYLVALKAEDGQRYVGPPEGFDWLSVAGAHLIAHNAAFDGMVQNRLVELGKIPAIPYTLDCTADMVAFFCIPRSLKTAAKEILGLDISKAVRTAMDGKTLRDLGPADAQALLAYGDDDAKHCLMLWQAKSAEWPEVERKISRLNREAGWRGIRIDRERTVEGLAIMRDVQKKAEAAMPWTKRTDPKTKAPVKAGSTSALAMHIKDCGLPVPRCFNKQDPSFQAWVEKHKGSHPFIRARLDHASVAPHIARLESMVALADEEDIVRFDSKYHAAHTGRSSGSSSEEGAGGARLNMFNIPKGDKDGLTFGVNLRGLMIPRPGYKFATFDYSNVEPRITHWLAGNTEFLKLVFRENIYQAAAKVMGWFPENEDGLKKRDPKTYALSKACTIGLGYGMGASKFLLTCDKMGIELPAVPKGEWNLDRRLKFILLNHAHIDYRDPANEEKISRFMGADRVVAKWRQMNPQVQALWKALQSALEAAAENRMDKHVFTLPSGRKKAYYNPHFKIETKTVKDPDTMMETMRVEKRLFASVVKGYPPVSLHGGPITENLVQSIARDIMFWGVVDIVEKEPTFRYVMNCYDEVVTEVPEAEADRAAEVIPKYLCEGSAAAWTPGLPLAVEGGIFSRYEK